MRSFYLTDVGKVRDHNEDSVIILKNHNNDYMLAVADGMGGHRAGEVASSIAISYLGRHFQETFYNLDKEQAILWINDSIDAINKQIFKHEEVDALSVGMGTTLVIALYTTDYLLFGNIGDSSGYVVKNKQLHKITTDHTLVNLLVKSGELTEEEAKEHPRKNVLMKALGANVNVEMDIFNVEKDVDGVFLCSDGLTNMLDDDQIVKVLNDNLSCEEKMQKLIYKCNNRGGNDNISVAYLIKDGASSNE